MTSEAMPRPAARDGRQPEDGGGSQISVEAAWEKALIPTTGGQAALLVRVTAPPLPAAARRVPLDVAFVLDRSGSMRSGKLDLAKEGVSLALSRLRDADLTALVAYDHEVATIQSLAAATPRLKAGLRLALHGVDPGGSTYLSGGWLAGCQELADAPAIAGDGDASRIRRVILLTDGLANVGLLDPRKLAEHAGQLRTRSIATTTLGVGQDFDEGLLSAMAEAGGGNFQYAADAAALREFFARELQELLSIVATNAIVTLALPPGVSAALVSAFPAAKRDSALDVAIGDMAAGDAIEVLFGVDVVPGREGGRLPLGVIASWTDPREDRRYAVDASPASLRWVAPLRAEAEAGDADVAERAALQRAAAERRAGLELDRAGRFAEARAKMRDAYVMVSAAPMTEAVRQELEDSFELAEAPPTAAYGSHERKTAQHREALRRRGRITQSEEHSTAP
jgi:Ca-activated chloride channel family protein